MRKFLTRFAGIMAGALYALMLRLVFNIRDLDEAFSLFSITFIWLVPIIIGIIPLLFATNDQIQSWMFRMTSPVLTVVVFFLLCFLTRIEDLICLWVILFPYVLVALTCGLIAGGLIERIRRRSGTLVSILLLPFIACPLEQQFPSTANTYSVSTNVIIRASPDKIWKHIIRVSEIKENEYKKGFFNYAGIPRPLYAELDKDTLGAKRTGYFEGGLQFIETVTQWEKNKQIGFDIVVVPSSIRATVFDQHILKGNHFKFLNAGYTLLPHKDGTTELILNSSYQLKTKINPYASFCGRMLLEDFQERLLEVIKNRCEGS